MAAMAGPIQPGRVCASGRVRWMGSIITDGCRNVEWRPSSPRDVHRRATRQSPINLWERMTKQRPSITSTVMVLDPLIYKLGNAIETCTPFLDRVPPLQTIIFSSFPGRTKVCRQTGKGIRLLATKGVLSLSVSALGCGNIMLKDESHSKYVVRGRPNAGEADSPICWKR